ncbi:8-amino-7-oxononanoate synthase [Kerstersia sp.]|uniref:8-amino-7-oxononanoate synthase n=1 Tax=Kerstersia sp. TaxID=1930783 RepID=UPI003F8EED19
MSKIDSILQQHLDRADAAQARRHLRPCRSAPAGYVWREGQLLMNFSSNDYLGLSRHPLLVERAHAWSQTWGAGAQASRLVCGTFDIHQQVETRLAALKGTEAALLLASGWQANAAVLPALLKAGSSAAPPLVFCDKLNHASLHMGCQAAGARQIRYRHNDLAHLETLLQARAHEPGTRFIVTESVFSMDGDQSDVAALAALARRYHAFLYLDEAHATGVLGQNGMGLSSGIPGVDLAMGTFSKALGGFGAYIAGSRVLCDYLVNTCSGLIYTTALPPAVLGAMDAALELVPGMQAERARLQSHASGIRGLLQELGLDCGPSSTQIIPAIAGSAEHALALSQHLQDLGCLAIAIRPPTVPSGTSRLRLTLSAAHGDTEIDRLASALRQAARHLPRRP